MKRYLTLNFDLIFKLCFTEFAWYLPNSSRVGQGSVLPLEFSPHYFDFEKYAKFFTDYFFFILKQDTGNPDRTHVQSAVLSFFYLFSLSRLFQVSHLHFWDAGWKLYIVWKMWTCTQWNHNVYYYGGLGHFLQLLLIFHYDLYFLLC